jgi:MSHA biogenesis protein MshQ
MTARRVAAGLVALALGSIVLPLVAAPAFEAAGTAVGGTGAVSPAWPAHAAGDIALLFVETTGGQTATLSTAAGFVEITGSPQATGTTTNGTRITVFWARATTAAMASPTVAGPGDHVYAQILTYRGAAATGNPWNVTGGGVKATASTSVTVTGVTTTVADTLIVQAVARDNDSAAAAFSALANANLTSLTEQTDAGTTSGNGGGFVVWDGVKASAGATGNTTATVTSSVNAFISIALVEDPPSIFSHWRMDQTAGWNGTAGEVLDSGSGAFLGTAAGLTTRPTTSNAAPAIPGDPGTCHYGVFNRSNKDYVALPSGYPNFAAAAGAFTATAWIKSTNATLPGQRILIDDQNNTTPGGWGFSVGETTASGAGGLRFFYRQAATFILDTAPISSGEWLFVALTVSFEAGSNASRAALYAFNTSGTLVATATSAFTWTAGTDAGPSSIGGETNASGEGTNAFGFGGNIDEVRVYRQFLSQARLDLIRQETRPCAVVNHFSISHAGSGVACVDQAITITAHDATHTAVNAGALLVNLSTTNGKGTWTGILAGGGTLTDTVAGDGAATYQFAPGSNSVQLAFRYANLAATSETFGFNISGGGFSETTGTASGSDDPSFTMAQAGFQFRNVTDGGTTIPTQISGKPSNTGFNSKTLRIQAIRTDTVTGSCAGLFASQTRSVDLGAECNSPATCAARQVSVNATNIATSNNNGGAGASAYTGVSLTFNASSEADAVVTYPDAGQISLHARYDLDPLVAGYEMIGSSNTFVVRPFGLAFPGVNHSSTAAGALIGAAGDNFAMTVQAYQWASGEDANNDGIPDAGVNITDNGTVPNFASTVTVGRSANLPGVVLGTVSRGAACVSAATIALSGGTATAADWCYSEVGNVILTADVTNYISAGTNITGNSGLDGVAGGGYVGRFKPKHFVVPGTPALTNRAASSCAPASSFTYLDEDLSLGFALEARNTQNVITQNYAGAYARLNLATAASLGIGARSGATNLTPRVDAGATPSGSFANGVANIAVLTGIRRAAPDNPDGPFVATQFGIAPSDADGVLMQAYNQDVDSVGGNDHFAVGATTELRFGRLRVANGYGADNAGLQLLLDVQYWNGGSFTLNTLDSCTTLARANLALSFSGVVAACDTAMVEPSITFASGVGRLTLAAPGAGRTGVVTLTPQLGTAAVTDTYCPAKGGGTAAATASAADYLLGRWDDTANPDGNANTAYDDKPFGRASFGLFGSPPRNFIFFRENF